MRLPQKAKLFYKVIFPNFFIKYLKKELSDCNSVLDLGCGSNSPIQYCDIPFTVGVELFDTYLEESKRKDIHDKYMKEDIRKFDFKPKSFDAIIAIDVLEHLSKKEGYDLIKKMEKSARKKIIIFTPNGYVPQDVIDNNPLQEHKSGWEVEELKKLGFKIVGINGWKKIRGYRALIKYKPHFLWLLISDLSQKIVYHYPKLAFQFFAVKELSIND